MQKRFGGLRTIANILKILGIITAVIAVVGAVGIIILSSLIPGQFQIGGFIVLLGSTAILGGIVLGFFFLIGLGLLAVALIAFGEMLHLFVAMEENTRATFILLQSMNK